MKRQRHLTEHLTTRVGKTMRREVERLAKRQRRSTGAVVRQALADYLAHNRQNGADDGDG